MLSTMRITLHDIKIIREDHKIVGDRRGRILPRKNASSKLPPLKYMASSKVQEGKKKSLLQCTIGILIN